MSENEQQFLHVGDVPAFLYERMGVRITQSTLHKKWMPKSGLGPKPAGRWGGKPIYRPRDVLEWAKSQIREPA